MTTPETEPETNPYLQHEEWVKRRAQSGERILEKERRCSTRRDQQLWTLDPTCALQLVSKRTKMHHDPVDDSAVVDGEESEM
mmetsp:Transcript_26498/g.87892  ORF Transcript_26498/g.87892 Transcript_26498/m.87892 type:complete len:82 (+) Transcript_26498:765-1010(+)